MEGNGPLIGTPRELGVIIVGVNPIPVDTVCSRIMGFDPVEIDHIVRSSRLQPHPDGISVLGDNYDDVKQPFERPYSLRASFKSLKSIGKLYLS